MTLSEVERAAAAAAEDEVAAFVMDEEAFRVFYERTSRPLWAYLSRMTGSGQLADDLLQETYYRFLRARREYDSDDHRRNALYRIATNLTRDAHRRARTGGIVQAGDAADAPDGASASGAEVRTDVTRALARLKPRERQLLWLAYALGMSHREIADAIGVKTGSIKLMLWRARQRIAALLGATVEGRR